MALKKKEYEALAFNSCKKKKKHQIRQGFSSHVESVFSSEIFLRNFKRKCYLDQNIFRIILQVLERLKVQR